VQYTILSDLILFTKLGKLIHIYCNNSENKLYHTAAQNCAVPLVSERCIHSDSQNQLTYVTLKNCSKAQQ